MVEKPLRILIINNADEGEEFSEPIVKILGRSRVVDKQSFMSSFTQTRMTPKNSASKPKYSSAKKTPAEEQLERDDAASIECVSIYWDALKVHPSTGEVTFTHTLYLGSQLVIDQGQTRTENLKAFDGIISSGSPQGDDPMESHAPHYSWLLSTEIPFFGICCGHHLAGYLSGTPLIRDGTQAESGNLSVTIMKDDPIFRGLSVGVALEAFDPLTRGARRVPQARDTCVGCTITVKQMHNDAIDLPEAFEILASSDMCPVQVCACLSVSLSLCLSVSLSLCPSLPLSFTRTNHPAALYKQMMRDRRRPLFYSTQFHPEYHNAQLLYNFVELIKNPPQREAYMPHAHTPRVLPVSGAAGEMFVTEQQPSSEGKEADAEAEAETKAEVNASDGDAKETETDTKANETKTETE